MNAAPLYSELFVAQTATTTPAKKIDCRSYPRLTLYLTNAGTTSGGTIVVEEAFGPDWTGDWSTITTLNATDVDTSAAACLAYHFPTNLSYAYVRVRIATTITGGGTLSAYLFGN